MTLASGRTLLKIVVAGLVLYGMICADVVLRARHAYLEGEKAASPKEAYAWYESAATLFTPPESRWSRLAREKLPLARAQWKADLAARHIFVDDSQLQ